MTLEQISIHPRPTEKIIFVCCDLCEVSDVYTYKVPVLRALYEDGALDWASGVRVPMERTSEFIRIYLLDRNLKPIEADSVFCTLLVENCGH